MQTKNQLLLFADSNFDAVKFSHTLIYKKNYILNFPLPIKHSIGWTKQQKIANMNKLEEEGKNYKSQAEHACIPNCTSIVFDQKKNSIHQIFDCTSWHINYRSAELAIALCQLTDLFAAPVVCGTWNNACHGTSGRR